MIPEMTDPLGRYWHQPADIREAPMDETHVLLTVRQYGELSEYSDTMPSGVYPGKCWLWLPHPRFKSDRKWLLWYGAQISATEVEVCKREILLT